MQSIHGHVPVSHGLDSHQRAALLRPTCRCNISARFARRPRIAVNKLLQITCLKNYSGHDRVSTPTVNENGIVIEESDETPFKKILCANRGEIAVRVFRAGTELGLRTLAIYSPADRLQPHRYKADESYEISGPEMTPVQSYLDVEAIIALAKQQSVDAIHPGYGFLSENTTFARRCGEEGIVFIGPTAKTIEAMGDKTTARRLAEECGVPVVPGSKDPITDAQSALKFAKGAGFPVILKAAMGGGGRGMRVVHQEEFLEDSFARASNEAKAAFGDGRMFIEKYVESPRHIEVQILADNHALELASNETRYMTYVPGIDAYRGLSMEEIVYQAVLVMGAEVEHLQVKALVATLPVRLKILDVAGSAAGIYTFEPTPIGSSSPTGASAQQATAGQPPASARTQPDADVQKLWLIYRPGHYEIVYPAEGSEDLEKL